MRCEDVADDLAATADGSVLLGRSERRHVESCLRCQAELVQYRKVLRAMRALRTDVLGVRVQPLTQEQSQQLDLEPGVGLRIDSTDPGTIARTMGLQAGHILIEMNGRKLKSRDDITEELKKRGADGQIECVAIDRWGQHRTYTWKPDPGRQL